MMKTSLNRRSFLQKTSLGTLTSLIGIPVVFANNLPKGVELIGLNSSADDLVPGKHPDMIVLSNKPLNVETPIHLLDDSITPADKMFVRNNGLVPENIDVETWTLEFDGESCEKPKVFTLNELKTRFEKHSYQLTIECGGNSRSGFNPTASGNQWGDGAVSCGKWTGVRLKDVLQEVGVKTDAVYIGYYGKDLHISGDAAKSTISRGVPISKALEDETLLAWELNDAPIPLLNGAPLRLVIGGWPASVSGKWLSKISVRNIVHDGEKMEGDSYKMPNYPVEPGQKVDEIEMKIIESMPVKSILTFPKTGAVIKEKETLPIRGHAWAGDLEVKEVQVSIDFGATWKMCELKKPINRLSWQDWTAKVDFPSKGYYEVWVKATDSQGKSQPMVIPGWNPKGYLNNACHRIAVKVS